VKLILIIVATLIGAAAIAITVIFFSLGFWLSPQSPLSKSDAIVAISGGETKSRTLEAVRLYKDGWAPKLVFSGAALDPNSVSNAKAMELIAQGEGVPANDILLEENSENTDQNAHGVAKIVSDQDWHKVILVTSPYHQRRAYILFGRALGPSVDILNHSTTDQAWRRTHWWATDFSRSLTMSELQKTLFVLWSK
jgi:uncharacterized SAM-binding protein YcdF (DUF218 family)